MTLLAELARRPAANDDEVPEGAPGCRCTLPGVPSAFCRVHGEGVAVPASLRASFVDRGWPVLPGQRHC
jgi:hypothetical protein